MTPRLHFTLQVAETGLGRQLPEGVWPLSRPRIRRLLLASFDAQVQSADLTLRLVGNAEGQTLNRDFRGKDYPTNVLTFPYEGPPHLSGDLVFCLPVIVKEAKAQGKSVEHHLMHLIVHGCLHACGLDHEDEAEAENMEALEVQILQRFRIPNPYGKMGAPQQPMQTA